MNPIETILALLVAVAALAWVAARVGVAYPILLVLGGLAIGFVPGLPQVALNPDYVFVLFLPPILFGAAYFTPIRDFKANARPILLLAVGLVLFTTVVVGVVANALIPGMSLADEKHAFAKRLKDGLRKVEVDPRSSTRVAREFNLRYPGDPISTQAVRKWLEGESLPSQDKLRALALWLDVPAQWLARHAGWSGRRALISVRVLPVGYRARGPKCLRGCIARRCG